MMRHHLLVKAGATVRPPAAPAGCAGRLQECARLQWRLGEPGDPALLAEAMLAEYGLLAKLADPADSMAHHDASGICGAALFVSAAAGAWLAGGATGPASPAAGVPDVVVVVYRHAEHPAPPPRRTACARPYALGAWRASWSAARHAAAVDEVRASIAAGEVYQVNLVGHAQAEYRGDPLAGLRRLAALPGARYAGLLDGDGWLLACASPETLVQVRAGRVLTRPIKGTAPATDAGRAALLGSAKERAEHVMIVDLERNDLARVARTGSVRVDRLYAVRRWCDLWQAESVISAELADGVGLADLLRAVCPGGSVTGAPKLAALAEIARREPVGRGPSMGALGWVGPGQIDVGLTIRTAAAVWPAGTPMDQAGQLHVWAGGGITWDSDPAAEVAEAAAKAAPLRAALAAAGSLLVEDGGPQHLVDVEGLA